MNKKCESCLIPFDIDTGQRESDKYCSMCFKDGQFTYEGDLKNFQKICYNGMREHGMNYFLAKLFTYLIRFAPRWRNK